MLKTKSRIRTLDNDTTYNTEHTWTVNLVNKPVQILISENFYDSVVSRNGGLRITRTKGLDQTGLSIYT